MVFDILETIKHKGLRRLKLEENFWRVKRNKEILHEAPPRPDGNLGLLNKLFNSLAFQQLFQIVWKESDFSYLCTYVLGINDTQISWGFLKLDFKEYCE